MTALKVEGRLFHYDRTFSSYSNIPSLFQPKAKYLDQSEPDGLNEDFRARFRSGSSSLLSHTDERRRELDQILQHLYEGKRLPSVRADRPPSESSDSSLQPSKTASQLDEEPKTPRNDDVRLDCFLSAPRLNTL